MSSVLLNWRKSFISLKLHLIILTLVRDYWKPLLAKIIKRFSTEVKVCVSDCTLHEEFWWSLIHVVDFNHIKLFFVEAWISNQILIVLGWRTIWVQKFRQCFQNAILFELFRAFWFVSAVWFFHLLPTSRLVNRIFETPFFQTKHVFTFSLQLHMAPCYLCVLLFEVGTLLLH